MKEGWEYKKLGEVGIFVRGGNFSKKDFVEIGFPCIHYGQIHTKFGVETLMHISSVPSEMVKQDRCAKKGDLVIAITSEDDAGSCKCTAWMGDYEVYVGGHTAIYRHTMQPKYVSYYFMSPYFQKDKLEYTHGFKVVEISPKDIAKISIPVPPLPEQQRIVDYLDSTFVKIDAMKANAEKSLNEAKALFQASLKEMLEPKEGWEEKKLMDLGQTQTGTTPSKSDKANYGDYMEFIRPSEIDYDGNGGIDYNSEMKLSEQGVSKGRIFPSNSIFMVCIGATIGKVGFSTKKVSCNQQINVFTPKEKINYKFAYYAMRSPLFQHRVIKEGTSSQATLPIINKGKWENLSIRFPEINEQKIIASHLDNLSSKIAELKANFEKISQECDALKQAILKKIFE